jgi:ssDNA-binding Zn-finger/Zn-ribbon topoisomerase 1
MSKWTKFTYVCDDIDECDTLVEATSQKKELMFAWCPACGKRLNLIDMVDATLEEVE